MKEKRRSERKKEENEVTIIVGSEATALSDKKICRALTKDISLHGIKIQCDTFFPIATTLKLKIMFEHPSYLINTYGEVRWIRRLSTPGFFEIGLEFKELSAENLKILKEHIEEAIC